MKIEELRALDDLSFVLSQHMPYYSYEDHFGGSCSCGWSQPDFERGDESRHHEHLAAELVGLGVGVRLPTVKEPPVGYAPIILTAENRYSVLRWLARPQSWFTVGEQPFTVITAHLYETELVLWGENLSGGRASLTVKLGDGIDMYPDLRIIHLLKATDHA